MAMPHCALAGAALAGTERAMQHLPSAARPQRTTETLALLLRQRDLQPHLPQEADRRSLTQTCKTLRRAAIGDTFVSLRGCVSALSRQFFLMNADTSALRMRMAMLHDPARHGPLDRLVADCRDVIWASDAHFGRQPAPPHDLPSMDAERRRQCIAYLWAVRHDGTVDQGLIAVDAAREPDRLNLYGLLAVEAAAAAAVSASLGAGGYIAYRGAGFAAHSLAGWRTATWAARAKATALASVGGLISAVGVWVAKIGVEQYREHRQEMAHDRAATLSGTRGRDLLLCELVTGRRYRGLHL